MAVATRLVTYGAPGTRLIVKGDPRLTRTLDYLRRQAFGAAVNIGRESAVQIARMIKERDGPAHQGLAPLAPLTLAKRRLGKRAGIRPAEPTYPGARPLVRSGRLLDAVGVRRSAGARLAGNVTFVVGFPAGARAAGTGQLLKSVAQLQEYGGTVTFPITAPALRYLRVLAEGRAGPPGGPPAPAAPADQGEVVKTGVAVIPPRPVWRRALLAWLDAAPSRIPDMFTRGFAGKGLPIKFSSTGRWGGAATGGA